MIYLAFLLVACGSIPLLAMGLLALWAPTRRASAWVFGAALATYGGMAGYVWAQPEAVGPHEAGDALVLGMYFAIGASGPVVALLVGVALLVPRASRGIGFRVLRWLPLCLVGAAVGFAIGRLGAQPGARPSPIRTAHAFSERVSGCA